MPQCAGTTKRGCLKECWYHKECGCLNERWCLKERGCLKSVATTRNNGTAKSTGIAKSAVTAKSAGATKSAGTAQIAFTATTSTRSGLAASPGSTGTKKKGSKNAALVERKGSGGAQIVVPLQFRREEDEDIPCGQRENMDWLLELADFLGGQSTTLPSVLNGEDLSQRRRHTNCCSLYKESPRARPLPLFFPFTIRTPG